MNSKKTLRISIALLFASFALSASAAPKDGAALKKIDEAINVHYLATEFDKAEAQLLGVIKACGKDCSPNVIAKAYMYIGLVRGSGKQNMAAAREAFEKAKASDPAITLDAALATPEVQAEFNKTKAGAGGAAAPAAAQTAAPPAAAAAAAEGGFTCTPAEAYEIQVRQPIPVSCVPPAGVVKGELYYRTPNAEEFKMVPMNVAGGTLRGQIPCDGVSTAGALNFYVIAQDANGDTIETLGSEVAPSSYNIVAQSAQPAPAYPGASPPARCGAGGSGEKVECPPGMPGCAGGGGWGDSCTPAEPCKKGLYCAAGTCENAPSCEVNSDCDSGRCNDGFCQMGDSGGPGGGGKFRRVMIGVHFAPDIWITSQATDVCGNASIRDGSYTCYRSGMTSVDTTTPAAENPDAWPLAGNGGFAGNVQSGAALATLRLLLSLDYALTPNLTLGGRAGVAFRGGPPSIKYNGGYPAQSTKFLPLHIELRAAYWLRPLSMPGIHPYLHIGGGMAQVDGKVPVSTYQCADRTAAAATGDCGGNFDNTKVNKFDAWRKMGQGFGTVGGGAVFPLGPTGGIQANVNFMYMLPATGIVIEPSIGYVMGL